MSIIIKDLNKSFGTNKILENIQLTIHSRELLSLLGPSGSGKTTLLRIIAGLEFPDSGQISFEDQNIVSLSTQERKVGFVFQHYALFKQMTIFENIAFGLKIKPSKERPSKKEIQSEVEQLLELVQLSNLRDRYPAQLSGGQKQRVALARALIVKPKILLLDEPFGALDARVRKELRNWLRKLHDEMKTTTIFVTHDQDEALELSDRVVIMNRGQIEQIGSPDEVYLKPATPFVYNFLGNVNVFEGHVQDNKLFYNNVELDKKLDSDNSKNVYIYVRPYEIELSKDRNSKDQFRGQIHKIYRTASTVRMEVLTEHNHYITVEVSNDRFNSINPAKNDEVYLSIKDSQVFGENYGIDFVI